MPRSRKAKKNIFEAAKQKTGSLNSEDVITMTTKSVGTFMMEAKRKLTITTRLLVAGETVEVFPNKLFDVLVRNLTKKAIIVTNYTRLAGLAESPTAVVNILDDTSINQLNTQIESVKYPRCIEKK